MAEIIARDVSFSYTEAEQILDNVTIDIPDGKFVCLLGQSGCGKSTFLRLVANLHTPDSGAITYDGKSWAEQEPDLSVIFQDYGLFPWFTAGKNIVLAMKQKYKGVPKAKLEQKVRSYLSRVGLGEEVFDKYPFELSGGMRQRCAICQSLCLDSEILLMDEPFGALDAVTRAHLQDMLLEMRESEDMRKTVLFVTHDVEEAILLADKIVVLGLKPSRVIYEYNLTDRDGLDRGSIYTDERCVELRNTLLRKLGEDVAHKSAEDAG